MLIKLNDGFDLILVEGYKFSKLPKFEVIRREVSEEHVCRKETLIGVITDSKWQDDQIPTYNLSSLLELANVVEEIIKVG